MQARALGGAFSQVAVSATAFPHRKAIWEVQVYTGVSGPSDESWVRSTKSTMKKYSSGYEYVNYLDCKGTTDPWTTYFASNAPRLRAIKKQIDPANRFDALSCH